MRGGPPGLSRLAKLAPISSTKASLHDIGIDESQQQKQGFFEQVREGLFGVLFVMAKDTHVVKKRHVILLFINLLQVCVGSGCIAAAFFHIAVVHKR
jgi:hypothetical protein